ncbi:MAG: YhjD/YihY/BrkB family envelope integrity protein [Planctomycetota bacterium]|jgi:membrane protein
MFKDILTAPTEELGRWSRFVVFQLKLWPQCARLLKRNRSGQQAAALSYHTVFGIVPLAIVMLMTFQIFPAYRQVGDKVKDFVYSQVQLDNIDYTDPEDETKKIEITDKIDEITAGFIAKLDKGSITLFSSAIVVWAALGLLTTIERAFNSIWHVVQGRSFIHRIINYWALLTLGPLLLGLGFYASTHYALAGRIQTDIGGYLRPVLPYLISVTALFFLYFVLPNTKVSAPAALWGAAMAALIWTGAKIVFRVYVTKFIPFQAVYGILGLIPLGVLWIYVTWLIVLFGLQLTFTTQHLKTLDAAQIAKMQKSNEYFIANDFTVVRMLEYILKAFEEKKAPVSAEVICSKLNLPADFGERILEHLTEAGLLFRTAEPRVGYTPATDGANITLAEISQAISKASFAQPNGETPAHLSAIFDAQNKELARHTLKEIFDAETTVPNQTDEG